MSERYQIIYLSISIIYNLPSSGFPVELCKRLSVIQLRLAIDFYIGVAIRPETDE